MADVFNKILSDASSQGKLADNTTAANSWLQNKAKSTPKADSNQQALQRDPTRLKTTIKPGSMYFFAYDAKGKDTLPFYDRFPLIFPLRMVKNGFYGLNFHYLPYKLRAILFDELMKNQTTNNKMDNTTKMIANYRTLQSISNHKLVRPCIKMYLANHVKSRFIEVSSSEWQIALFLPNANFGGTPMSKVWEDSQRIVRKTNKLKSIGG